MKVGGAHIESILDGSIHAPVAAAVSHPEGKAWDCPQHPQDDLGRLRFDTGAFLLRFADRTVLVDAGTGPHSDERMRSGDLLDNLRLAGVSPGDITDLVLTHLHWDHIGWASLDEQPVFTNATVHVNQHDWDHFLTGESTDQRVEQLMLPLQSRVNAFDSEAELLPGLLARPAPGHTPGSTIYVVHSEGERALLLGDVTHAIAELTEPEWLGMWDVDQTAARQMRNLVADQLAASGDRFAPAHFPNLSFGRLLDAEGIRRLTWA